MILPDTPPGPSQPSIVSLLSPLHEITLPQKRPLQRTQSENSPVSKTRKHLSVERVDLVQSASPRSNPQRGIRRTATVPPTLEECEQDGYDHSKELPQLKQQHLFKNTSSSLPFRAVTPSPLAECDPALNHRQTPQHASKDATFTNKVSKTNSATITITSSPPGTPASRRSANGKDPYVSRQREITSWVTVSPSSARQRFLLESGHLSEHGKAPESPSPLRSLPRPTAHAANSQDAADALWSETNRNLNDKGSGPAMQSETTAQVPRRSPRLCKHGNSQSTTEHSTETSARSYVKFKTPRGLDADTPGRHGNEKQVAAGQVKKKVRLRESMPGAWEFIEENDEKRSRSGGGIKGTRGNDEDIIDFGAGTEAVADGSVVDNRVEKRYRRGNDKQWRMSQVEVLDLSKWT